MRTNQKWGVVGGGLLGMTLALRLAQQGNDVSLFEGAPYLGGVAAPWQLEDVVWDRHYHVILKSDIHLRNILSEIGLEPEINWVETRTGFYTDSRLYSMSNTVEFLTFPPLNMIDKFRLGSTILYASRIRDPRKLETIPVDAWLTRWSGRRTVEKIWIPLLRSKLGENYKKASASFIWAIIARMYAARRAGMKREMFGYVPGGYSRIIEHFARRLADNNVTVHLGRPTEKIEPLAGGQVRMKVGGEAHCFDQVAVTTASPIAARLCPDLSSDEQKLLNRVEYQGIICASLLLKKPLANFYVTNITDPWVPYTAVIEMTAVVDREHFGGRSLVYLPKYVPSDSPEFGLSDESIRERFLEGLERMYPRFERSDVICFRVSRVKYLLPIATINYSEFLPPISTSVPGVHIVNSAHIVNGTLNVNETVQLAEKAAELFSSLPLRGAESAYEYEEAESKSVA